MYTYKHIHMISTKDSISWNSKARLRVKEKENDGVV